MATPHDPDAAMLVIAVFTRHDDAFAWAVQHLQDRFGPLAASGPVFDFHHTHYYEATMGPSLRKQLLAFQRLVQPDSLPNIKLMTNEMENDLAKAGRFPEARPLNLDPGLLTLGKFILATTKDQAHRIYLRDGIFAEVTLRYQARAFEPWPWTYADYREASVRQTLKEFREEYKKLLSNPCRHRKGNAHQSEPRP